MREEVPAALAGERLDRAVAMMTGWTRAAAAAAIDAGGVAIDGRAVTTRSRKLAEGETIEIDDDGGPTDDRPQGDATVAVALVHEDADLLVVDKPAGLVVHPGNGQRHGTLVHGLLARYPELAGVGEPDRPGIVHRLDKGTSGLLAVARSALAYDALVEQLSSRSVERRYRALVHGSVEADAGIVDAPVGRSVRDRTRMAVTNEGREARTRYEVVDRRRDDTVVDCVLETGRTHQIRVHMAAIGHPVVGDDRYGGGRGPGRPFLHAAVLGLRHPRSDEHLRWTSPLPSDLEAWLLRTG